MPLGRPKNKRQGKQQGERTPAGTQRREGTTSPATQPELQGVANRLLFAGDPLGEGSQDLGLHT